MKRHTTKTIRGIVSLTLSLILVAGLVCCPELSRAAKRPVLNHKSLTVTVGSRKKLRVKYNKKKVKWSSSRRKVAVVSSKGMVRAKKQGTAKITAKVGKKKYVCRVTVVSKASNSSSSNVTLEKSDTNETAAETNAKKVLKLVNEERKKEGLPEMVLDNTLCEAANIRAKEIVEKFSHTRPDGTRCFTVLEEFDFDGQSVGENIATGQQTAAAVMSAWMNSQGHRENIMNPEFRRLGVGYVKVSSGYKTHWVQLFSN